MTQSPPHLTALRLAWAARACHVDSAAPGPCAAGLCPGWLHTAGGALPTAAGSPGCQQLFFHMATFAVSLGCLSLPKMFCVRSLLHRCALRWEKEPSLVWEPVGPEPFQWSLRIPGGSLLRLRGGTHAGFLPTVISVRGLTRALGGHIVIRI